MSWAFTAQCGVAGSSFCRASPMRYLQVLLQPPELVADHLDAVVEVVVVLGGHGDEVHRTHVEAEELPLWIAGHAEAGLVVAEVAEN